MCSLGGSEVKRGREGRRERVKRWVVAGERKGERAQRGGRWWGVSGSRAKWGDKR